MYVFKLERWRLYTTAHAEVQSCAQTVDTEVQSCVQTVDTEVQTYLSFRLVRLGEDEM